MLFKGTVKTYTFLVAMNVSVAMIAISTSILITHAVAPEEYGKYNLYLSLISLAVMIFIAWPNAALLRFARENWSQKNNIGEALASRLILFFCGIIITGVLCWIFRFRSASFIETKDNPFLLLLLGLCLFPLSDIAIYAAQSTSNFLSTGYTSLVNKSIFLIGLLVTIEMGVHRNWKTLAVFYIGGLALSSIIAFLYLPKEAWREFKPSKFMLGRILHYSWALPFGALAAYVVNWVDSWVIRAYMGTKSVGIYTWAYQIVSIGGAVFSPTVALFAPKMIDAKVAGEKIYFTLHVKRGLIVLIVLSILIDFGIVFLDPLMQFLGKSYQATYPVLLILIATLPIQFLGYWMTPVASTFEHLVPLFVLSNIGVAIIKTAFDLILVPYFGIQGAAIATFIAFLFGSLSCFLLIKFKAPGLSSLKIKPFLLFLCIVPLGVFCILSGGPIVGSLLCLSVPVFSIVLTKYSGIFTAQDFDFMLNQTNASLFKKAVAICVRWIVMNKKEIS